MQKTDIILLVPLILGAVWGYYRGIISQLTSFAGIVVAIYCAVKYSGAVAALINKHVDDEKGQHYISIAAFILVLVAVLLLIFFISRQVEKLTKALNIGFINHIAGGIFGFAKWAFIISAILILLNLVNQELGSTLIDFHHTWIYNHIAAIIPRLMPDIYKKFS